MIIFWIALAFWFCLERSSRHERTSLSTQAWSRALSRRDTLVCAAAGWIDVQRDLELATEAGVSQAGAAPIILLAQKWRRYG